MQADFTYQRVSSKAELKALGPQWQTLHASQPQQLLPLAHVWHLAWWQNFGENLDLSLGCVFGDGNLVAIAPLPRTTPRILTPYNTIVRERLFAL